MFFNIIIVEANVAVGSGPNRVAVWAAESSSAGSAETTMAVENGMPMHFHFNSMISHQKRRTPTSLVMVQEDTAPSISAIREHSKAMVAHSGMTCHNGAVADGWVDATVRLLLHLIHQSSQTNVSLSGSAVGSSQYLARVSLASATFRPGPNGMGAKIMSNARWSLALQRAGKMIEEIRELAGIWNEVETEASNLLRRECVEGTPAGHERLGTHNHDPHDDVPRSCWLRVPDTMLLAAANVASEEDCLCCLQCLSLLTCTLRQCSTGEGGSGSISDFESLLNLLILSCYYARRYSHPGEAYSALGISLSSISRSKRSYTTQLGALLAATRCRKFGKSDSACTRVCGFSTEAQSRNLLAVRLVIFQSCITTMFVSAWCLGIF
ncbi:hypothetical protein CEUSTIGMA_g5957.t1 [Chlamydomonas eustigma]|uniref:Uncharacterized protein n=1 Tax=Chlamydomonas eustigma TaxID=1157962 RepID=A0A250X601_9CHLO|nr:hypothetical protein CEUSTIGMA_g5957.t1 [Chlamydomonas eustigma]|eukprot:GAX78517.1 hypothetical protein CEUSTIGMA_g5957.t1 [Chlamydomonas eustigma]